jgi:hypothetical protein
MPGGTKKAPEATRLPPPHNIPCGNPTVAAKEGRLIQQPPLILPRFRFSVIIRGFIMAPTRAAHLDPGLLHHQGILIACRADRFGLSDELQSFP